MDALSDRSGLPSPLPLVGRSEDLDVLNGVLADGPGSGPVTFLTGEGGIGKSRLIRVLTDDAGRRGWTVAYGRAFPMERGVPYALLTDAFLPLIREMDSATVTVLSRGTERDLGRLFPPLDLGEEAADQEEDPAERKSRIHWHFAEFVLRLGKRQPLLLVLEDLQWADPSSLELLHFLTRRIESGAVRILASYNSDDRDGNEALVGLERSLVSMRKLRLHPLRPLDRRDTTELVTSVFRVSSPPVLEFADLLYGWTRGNPFFIEQTLEALVVAGRLHRRDGVWLGWELRELELPSTIRDAIEGRLGRLSEEGRRLAEVLAVTGGRAPVLLLGTLLETPGPDLSASIEELAASGLVDEEEESGTLALEFRHPLIRETLTQRMSLVRTRRLHEQIALALERFHGEAAERHADELAYHFSRAGGPSAPRAVRYLVMAGREALRRHADREAAEYLQAGVHQLRELQGAGDVTGSAGLEDLPPLHVLRGELARALARSGRHEPAGKIWHDLAEEARERGAAMDVAEALRHLGLLCFWTGRHREAIGHYDAALEAAGSEARHLRARIDLAAGVALQELGEPDAARKRIARALAVAEELSDPALMARVHRASALVATWNGRPARARSHASQAIELAREAGDLHVEFWARWALAALEGLVGDVATSASQLDEARTLAEELHSPVLGLSVSELAVELCSATGDWDEALAQGERAISVATALNQHGVLIRLMVWTAIVYLGRGEMTRGRELIEGAWGLAHQGGEDRPPQIHAVVPAFIGKTALLLAEGRHQEAVRTGEEGLAVADASGYVIWVLHRMLPLLGEAYLRAGDVAGGMRVGERLRREGGAIEHRLGLALANACDAVVAWHSGDMEGGAVLLREAGECLEAIPFVFEAARVRRQLAGRLADLGDREGALAQLRELHDVFGRLGAEPELEKVRGQFRELGARAPQPSHDRARDGALLTPREMEVALALADRRTNKGIASQLGIAPRTVTTHLSNIYKKLGIGSRGELIDRVREGGLLS